MKIFFSLFILFCCVSSSYAEDEYLEGHPLITDKDATFASYPKKYYLKELGITISVPSNCSVFLQDIQLEYLDIPKDNVNYSKVIEEMKKANIYLDAVFPSETEEIIVVGSYNKISNFSSLDKKVFEELVINEMPKFFIETVDARNFHIEIYEHNSARYAKANYIQKQDNESIAKIQYYTVYKNMAINIVYISHLGSISKNAEQIMKKIVDSLKYDSPLPTPKTDRNRVSKYRRPIRRFSKIIAGFILVFFITLFKLAKKKVFGDVSKKKGDDAGQ